MFRLAACAALSLLFVAAPAQAGEFGTSKEAKAMLERAVAAVKEDKAKALDMFNKGEGGFKDRDLYVFCASASDGVLTAHPNLKGETLQKIKGKKGFPLGQEIMRTAAEGEIKEVTYWWPRPGSDKPFEKRTFYTKVGDRLLQRINREAQEGQAAWSTCSNVVITPESISPLSLSRKLYMSVSNAERLSARLRICARVSNCGLPSSSSSQENKARSSAASAARPSVL
jgi:Single Cache domain 2